MRPRHKRRNLELDINFRQAFNALCETGTTEQEKGWAEYPAVC
jgi:hypothetical protein